MGYKRKILFLHETLRQGGTSRQIMYLYYKLDLGLFEPIFVIYREDEIFYKGILENDKVFVLKKNKESYVQCMKKFIMILRKEKPDCVQSFNPRMNHFLYVASLVCTMPPLFVSVRNTNLSTKKRLFEFIFQKRFNKLIVNSTSTKRELTRRAWINKDKISIIYNALDANYYFRYNDEKIKKLKDSNGIDPDTFLILSIGRIHKQKNILCTLKALSRLKKREESRDIRLWHIGYKQDKGLYMKMLSFIAANDMEGMCYFMEPVHDIVHFYNMADVMVLSSLWEGLSNVVLEAMSCESIVVVAESADNDRTVDHGVTGFKFKKNDDSDLACILEKIMGLGEEEKRQIRKKARLEVMRRFSTDKMVREFQALYQAV